MINLSPNVTKIKLLNGEYSYTKPLKYFFLEHKVNAFIFLHYNATDIVDISSENSEECNNADLIFKYNDSLKPESYILKIDEKVIIEYSTDAGAYYAVQTLKHYIKDVSEEKVVIPKLDIFDEPKTKVRGLMLDISRNKVAKPKQIKEIIDLMTVLKMNHLELYVEGFSFEYKSFKEYLEEDAYITLEEYLELEKYANERFIDFVPNQNGFGHMEAWLEKEKVKDLAICPNGINLWGRWRRPSTLNPLNPGSLDLVKKMYADMIPYTKSKYFNMDFDEPFELSKGLPEGEDVEEVYLDFVEKVYNEIKKYNKTPLLWGDVLVRHESKWDRLPKDMIFLDWGYDATYSFANHAKKLSEKKVKFMCAPGTTSWSSFFGRYIDWYENIKNAVDAVYNYSGEGVILTDWGDFGHLQFWPISLAPLIYMGLYSWSHKEGIILKIRDYLNEYLQDKDKLIGDLILDLENSYRYDNDYCGNGSRSFYTFMWASVAKGEAEKLKITPYEYFVNKVKGVHLSKKKFKVINELLDLKLQDLDLIDKHTDELKLVCEELKQTILIVKLITHLSVTLNDDLLDSDKLNYLDYVLNKKDECLDNHKTLWLKRNKSGGLKKSLEHLSDFFELVNETKLFLMKRGKQ
ncbi:MAG: family 20 glycosylhydrolase [Bacilli bacterium]|nr:family 20 glycosylhydrolase [Bacilli bacterium]